MEAALDAVLGTLLNALLAIPQAILRAIGNGFQAALGFIGQGIMTIFRTIAGVIIQAFQGLLQFLLHLPNLILGAVTGILGVVAKLGVALGGLAVGALAGFVKAIQLSTDAALSFAKDAAQLHATTGLSYGTSTNVLRNFAAFGVSGQSVNSAFGERDPEVSHWITRYFKLPDFTSANFIPSVADRYQKLMSGGMFNRALAGMMMRNVNMDTPEMKMLASLPVSKIREQLSFSNSVYGRMGLGGGGTQKGYAEDYTLSLGKITILIDAIKQKVAQVVLPMLQSILEAATKWTAANAGTIARTIEHVAIFIYAKLPLLLTGAVIKALDFIQGVIGNFISFTSNIASATPTFLDALAQNAANMLRGFANFIQGTGQTVGMFLARLVVTIGYGIGSMLDWANNALQGGANRTNPLRAITEQIAMSMDNFVLTLEGVSATIVGLIAGIQSELHNSLLNNLLQATMPTSTIAQWVGAAPVNPITAYTNTLNSLPQPNAYTTVSNFWNNPAQVNALNGSGNQARQIAQNIARQIYGGITGGSNWAGGQLNGAADFIAPQGRQSVGNQLGNWISDHLQELDASLGGGRQDVNMLLAAFRDYQKQLGTSREREIELLKAIAKHTEKMAREEEDLKKGTGAISGVAAAIIGEQSRLTGRSIRATGAR